MLEKPRLEANIAPLIAIFPSDLAKQFTSFGLCHPDATNTALPETQLSALPHLCLDISSALHRGSLVLSPGFPTSSSHREPSPCRDVRALAMSTTHTAPAPATHPPPTSFASSYHPALTA